MAQNQLLDRGGPLQVGVPAALAYPYALNGAPLLFGNLPCVAQENDGDATRPAPGVVTVFTDGVFNLPVTAATALSPLTGSAVKPGDKIYYDGGTVDSNTGITYGGTLTKNSSTGVLFGLAMSVLGGVGTLVNSAATATIAIRLRGTN